jgi:ABC-type antimicrobial peptide transport system permease subunit
MMLTVDEQHQEYAILRAVGAKPRFVVVSLAIQSLILLLSSFGIGILFGTIITVLILMQQPIITGFTMFQITLWLASALSAIFILSLYPAYRLAKTAVLKIMT